MNKEQLILAMEELYLTKLTVSKALGMTKEQVKSILGEEDLDLDYSKCLYKTELTDEEIGERYNISPEKVKIIRNRYENKFRDITYTGLKRMVTNLGLDFKKLNDYFRFSGVTLQRGKQMLKFYGLYDEDVVRELQDKARKSCKANKVDDPLCGGLMSPNSNQIILPSGEVLTIERDIAQELETDMEISMPNTEDVRPSLSTPKTTIITDLPVNEAIPEPLITPYGMPDKYPKSNTSYVRNYTEDETPRQFTKSVFDTDFNVIKYLAYKQNRVAEGVLAQRLGLTKLEMKERVKENKELILCLTAAISLVKFSSKIKDDEILSVLKWKWIESPLTCVESYKIELQGSK